MSTLIEIEKGPTFAVYQGPMCVQRLDWSLKKDAARTIIVGYAGVENADALVRHLDPVVRSKQSVNIFHDYWDCNGYDAQYRIALMQWGSKKPAVAPDLSNVKVHILSRSKVLNMAISVATLAMPGIQGYGKRTDFDVLAMKLGLPLNPAMPALNTRATSST